MTKQRPIKEPTTINGLRYLIRCDNAKRQSKHVERRDQRYRTLCSEKMEELRKQYPEFFSVFDGLVNEIKDASESLASLFLEERPKELDDTLSGFSLFSSERIAENPALAQDIREQIMAQVTEEFPDNSPDLLDENTVLAEFICENDPAQRKAVLQKYGLLPKEA